jgi:hypothetical protein
MRLHLDGVKGRAAMRSRTIVTAGVALSALALAAGPLRARFFPVESSEPGDIATPSFTWGSPERASSIEAGVDAYRARVWHAGPSRVLHVDWEYLVSDTTRAHLQQSIPLDFWPTASSGTQNPLECVVAGVDAAGAVVMRGYTLRVPGALELQPVGGGPPSYELQVGGLESSIDYGAGGALGVVSLVTSIAVGHDGTLWLASDDKRVYAFDQVPANPPLLKVSGWPTDVGALVIPGLDADHWHVAARRHHLHGDLLLLSEGPGAGSVFVTTDAGLDGTPEAYFHVAGAEDWRAHKLDLSWYYENHVAGWD